MIGSYRDQRPSARLKLISVFRLDQFIDQRGGEARTSPLPTRSDAEASRQVRLARARQSSNMMHTV